LSIKQENGSIDRTALRALVVRSTQRTMAIEGRAPQSAPVPVVRAEHRSTLIASIKARRSA